MAVVAAVHAADSYTGTGSGRVNELRVTDINTDMGEASAARIKKYQITRRQLFSIDAFSEARHVDRQSGQLDIERMSKNKLHEPAAIKASLGRGAAPSVRRADVLVCFRYKVHALE